MNLNWIKSNILKKKKTTKATVCVLWLEFLWKEWWILGEVILSVTELKKNFMDWYLIYTT
jgi:hypothetical protein